MMNRPLQGIVLAAAVALLAPVGHARAADVAPLDESEGYLLIRIKVVRQERVSRMAFTEVDTRQTVHLQDRDFRPAGAAAWMAMVPAPEGRYFWSEYEAGYGKAIEESRDLDRAYRRTRPGSASDTFEVVADAINYAGDWTMREVSSSRRRLDPVVQYEKSTMERSVGEYPAQVRRYPMYLSMMGKAAISLDELAKIIAAPPE